MHTIEQRVLRHLTLQRNGVPIYVQIRQQILECIGSGLLAPGARMPTMRQVSVALKVDLNTVRHAYEDLRQGGIITLRQGQGSFVAAPPSAPPPVPPSAAPKSAPDRTQVEDLARRTIEQATRAGVDPLVLAEHIAGLIASKEISS